MGLRCSRWSVLPIIYRCFSSWRLCSLICNMLAFFSIGTPLENFYGQKQIHRTSCLFSLLCGSLASFLFNPLQTSAVGASGMIFGLFGCLRSCWKANGRQISERQQRLIAVNMAIPLLIPGIDWKAHLGGLIGGALTALVLKPARGNISSALISSCR